LRSFIDKLAGVGLPLYITEYDINEADDAKQAQIMSEQFPLFWNDDRIKGITLWGYVHGATWKANTGLVRNGTDRPAMTWLKQYLSEQGAL
jgi:GH35 family endo-1,4-beta-xylanase